MILCDIGNTNASFLQNGKITHVKVSEFKNYKPD